MSEEVRTAVRTIDRLIVALDHPTLERALAQVELLGDAVEVYKVGLELFVSAGPRAVEELQKRGKRVFLDLKLHDIPETVKRAAHQASRLGVEYLTVHAAGGGAMLAAASQGAYDGASDKRKMPRLLAVTVLTSMDAGDLRADGNPLSVEELVVKRADLTLHTGSFVGFVASVHEAPAIRALGWENLFIVTPGVRPDGARGSDDQKRVATAKQARAAGADAVVVGRPIRDAADPRAVVKQLLDELE